MRYPSILVGTRRKMVNVPSEISKQAVRDFSGFRVHQAREEEQKFVREATNIEATVFGSTRFSLTGAWGDKAVFLSRGHARMS